MIRTIASLFFFVSLSSGYATPLEVCHRCHFKTIAQAIAHAKNGDTIKVKPGTYPCVNIDLTKSLTLIGEDGATLDGQKQGYILRISADSVTISGFTLINPGRSYTKDYAAIYAFRVQYLNIVDNDIVDPFFGILLEKSKDGRIIGNKLHGTPHGEDHSGNGIHLWHCDHILIDSNEITGLRDGIYLEFVDDSHIQHNYAHDNVRYGLHFMFSHRDKYIGNTFENNGAGVAVMFSKFIEMRKNRFTHNWGTASYGLLLKEIYDAKVIANDFTKNTIGIYIDGTTRIHYKENLFQQNGWAIKVSGGCYQNNVTKNNFISNSFDIAYNTKMNDNSFSGNYWSNYTGYDLDKDGTGDVPYRPVKLFSYIVNNTPEAIVLLRSLFIDIINFSEKVSPIFTPAQLVDHAPAMQAFR